MHTTKIEKIKYALLLTIAMMLVIMGYQIWEHNQKKGDLEDIKKVQLETDADVVVKHIELTETSGTRVYWKLKARVAEIYTARKETRMQDLEIDFFDQNGAKNLHLVSDEGVKDDTTGDIIVSGNVKAVAYQEGVILTTSELVYDAETKLITSDEHVVIERGGIVTSGEGLESDLSLTEARILRNVTTSFATEAEGT